MTDSTKKTLYCGFCGKSQHEVKRLIAGPNVHICNECIDTCQDLIREQAANGNDMAQEMSDWKPRDIVAAIGEYLIGQDAARREVSLAVYKHFVRVDHNEHRSDDDVELDKSNVLIVGPSGCGKTYLVETMAKILGIPFISFDVSDITAPGYVGANPEDIFKQLYTKCDGDIEKMKRSIIFLDEIDKLRTGGGGGATRDVGGTDAQRTLLSILQGTEYSVEFERGKAEIIDTTGIQFIAGGSFAGTGGNKHELAEIIRTRLYKEKGTGKSSIGFNVDAPVEKDIDGNDRLSNEEIKAMKVEDLLPHVKDLDVMEFGILAELIGRLPSISYVLPLNEDELVSVLTLPRNALYKQYIKEFEIHGVELEFEHNALKEIARRAGKRKTGARALKGVMRTVMSELEMDVYSDEETDPAKQINHITITEDFIKGKADKPVIDRGPRKEKKAQAAKAQSNLKVADPWEDDAKPKK